MEVYGYLHFTVASFLGKAPTLCIELEAEWAPESA